MTRSTTPLRRLALVGAALASASCAGGPSYSPANPAPWDPESITYVDSLGVDLSAMRRTPSGLYIEDLKVGEGTTAQRTSLVTMDYIGYLPDGTIFDASVGGEPIRFRLGGNEVIRGWNEGIPGMRQGGVRRLVIRPSLGYRGQAKGKIPPNSTLVFDVRLLDVR